MKAFEDTVPEWPAYMWTDWIEGQRPIFKDDAQNYDDEDIIGYEPRRIKRLLTRHNGKYFGDAISVTLEDVMTMNPRALEAIIKTQEEVALLSLKDAIDRG